MITKILIALLPFALIACQSTPTDPNRIVVTQWNSDQGLVELRQQNIKVRGSYLPNEHGQIIGEMQGNVLQGYWIEDSSSKRCKTALEGRYYWGRMALTFKGGTFQGAWAYCNETPTTPWRGKLNKD